MEISFRVKGDPQLQARLESMVADRNHFIHEIDLLIDLETEEGRTHAVVLLDELYDRNLPLLRELEAQHREIPG